MIERDEAIAGLQKMIRMADREIGVAAALRDAEMRELAEWKRGILEAALKLIEK